MRARSPAVGSANRRRRCRQHLATQGDVFLVAVFGKIMADSIDGWDEKHGAGHYITNHASVMECPRRHASPISRSVLFRCRR